MQLLQLLDLGRVVVAFLSLSYATILDVRTREVSDWLWILMGAAGSSMTITTFLFGFYHQSWLTVLISVGLTSALALALFYIGLYGGADAKALIALSVTLPTPPDSFQPMIQTLIPIFPISVLLNGVIFSVLTVPYMALRNLHWKLANRRRLFEGLEHEQILKKIGAILSSTKRSTSELRKQKFYDLVEDVQETPEGVSLRFRIFARVKDVDVPPDLDKIDSLLALGGYNKELWVTPQLPMLAFVLVGFIGALALGDVITGLLTRLTTG